MKSPRIGMLKPRIATLDTRTAKPLPKEAAAHYQTPEHRAWALAVKRRAGWRCEHVENGERCRNRHPTSVIYADHRVEIRDDLSRALDPANGQALCPVHHTTKTIEERRKRMSR